MDAQPRWDWSSVRGDAVPDRTAASSSSTASASGRDTHTHESRQRNAQQGDGAQPQSNHRRYGPRSCRICLETQEPIFPPATSTTFGISASSSRPTYVSDDPELGRLLSPCKCKGSQKYVHEGCLNAWRLSNPTAERNYWQCPTCKFTYRLSRMHWSSMLSSTWARLGLTIVILVFSIFLLGSIADPILDLWFDPVGTLSDTVASVVNDIEARDRPHYEVASTWSEHFLKGFFSLGLLGFLKTMLAMGPWQWFNLRSSGLLGSRGRAGRNRMDNVNMIFVLIGAFTFMMGIWKAVKAISTRVLEKASDKVLDVDENDDDDDDDDEVDATETTRND